MKLTHHSTLIISMILSASSLAFADNRFESIATIQTIAKEFVEKHVALEPDETMDVSINHLESSRELTRCSVPLEANYPPNANREQISTIELSCNDAHAWKTYIPVTVKILTHVIVAKQIIPAKDIINQDMLSEAVFDKNTLYNGYFKSSADVIGQETSRLIPAGAVVTKRNIQHPVIVFRNHAVTIIARKNDITVSMDGIAKTDGSLNEIIKVFNPSSKKTLSATVVGDNKAEILF